MTDMTAEKSTSNIDCKACSSTNEGFSPWIYCICVVTFDLELGQIMESTHPKTVNLSKQEISNVCYLAFPDSNSGCMGDTQFVVRLRRTPANSRFSEHFLWGYVYFRQVKDLTLPRGYFQKSVVVLSTQLQTSVLGAVCSAIAQDYFRTGGSSLMQACQLINEWPPPPIIISGQSTSTILTLPLPNTSVQTNLNEENSSIEGLLPVASHAQLLWELVLICEPLVVFASTPTACSRTVLALVSMISPLVYSGDYRPYFTIHDSEFKEFTNAREPPATILGVTNPFFAKTLQHWPHIIRLCEGIGTSTVARGSDTDIADVRTTYRPFLRADKSLIQRLKLGRRPIEAQAALLRRHLVELTQSFMIPLERYMASLMPLQKNISPFRVSVSPLPFNPEKFLATLSTSGPQLTSGVRGNWEGLYRRFLRSSNFNAWFNVRHTELTRKLHALQLQALSLIDLKQWVQNKPEVEVVDMVLNIRKKLSRADEDCTSRERLKVHLQELLSTLPEDLRHILQVDR